MKNFDILLIKIHSLVIFRNILNDNIIKKLIKLIKIDNNDLELFVDTYADFCSALFNYNNNLSDYILNLILEDDNFFVKNYCKDEFPPSENQKMLMNELDILHDLSLISSDMVCYGCEYEGYLPQWEISGYDFQALYFERIKNIDKHGYGIFAKYHIFTIDNSNIIPVKNPEKILLSDLKGYNMQRQPVIDNTIALLNNKKAENILLYGDAGTGKSATVKAVANEYKDKGLRLIEIKKNQLYQIPVIVEKLYNNPLKFIFFIDDLSFQNSDDDFAALKAILEGSVSAPADNIVIYATSNRRHIIKETFSDRDGDDIHRRDTMEEISSLSDRFGIVITFSRPEKKQYTQIVSELAQQYGINMNIDELIIQAEAYAIRKGGRTPRAAKQFIQMLKAKQ